MEKKPSTRINEILEDRCYGDDRFLALAIRIYLDEEHEKQQKPKYEVGKTYDIDGTLTIIVDNPEK